MSCSTVKVLLSDGNPATSPRRNRVQGVHDTTALPGMNLPLPYCHEATALFDSPVRKRGYNAALPITLVVLPASRSQWLNH